MLSTNIALLSSHTCSVYFPVIFLHWPVFIFGKYPGAEGEMMIQKKKTDRESSLRGGEGLFDAMATCGDVGQTAVCSCTHISFHHFTPTVSGNR